MSIETLLEAAKFLEWQSQQQQKARGKEGTGTRAVETTLKSRVRQRIPFGIWRLACLNQPDCENRPYSGFY